ncbi:TPA: hypothetical protein ACQZHW_003578 [Enterobacter hormaechei]
MKELPLELLYRLYKANIGDTIENKYVRLEGGWLTDDNRTVSDNGFLRRSEVYQFNFKDLTDGVYYYAACSAKRAFDPTDPDGDWYYEPFVRSHNEPLPVMKYHYETQAVSIPLPLEYPPR